MPLLRVALAPAGALVVQGCVTDVFLGEPADPWEADVHVARGPPRVRG
jgi:hypothetical protein